ncbi:MAG: ABC-F family ATP-binding cassette domain-containing protein [Prevotellaceae bacterium]|jgi:ATP-binding cassette subfamily F protein uup|nr:ABC-F family ATP-binding cassette domain-containing protein [Prevotellaceae bacterium]
MASCLQVENLTKTFGDKYLFENISFGIADGQRVALIAKNGGGKTTLLSILAGEEDYQSGSISFRRDLRIGYLRQDPLFEVNMTVLEACFAAGNEATELIKQYETQTERIAQGKTVNHAEYEKTLARMDELKAWDYETRIKQILGKLKIHNFDQLIGTLSGGQLKRVALANVLISEPDLLILDEPTNHLDLEMVEWLESFLRNSKMALLMVTHDRYFLDRVCSDILEIDHEKLYHYKGNYSYFLQKKEERIDNFNAELEKVNNLYHKELDWIRRQPQARATKAKSRIDAFADIERRAKQRRENKQMSLEVKASYLGSKIVEAQYISKAYGDFKLLDHFYYNFSRYEKVGIVGKNGTGKTTFLKMLMGEVKPDSGAFDIGETVQFGYYSQDGLQFEEDMKVIDVVRDIAEEISLGNGRKLNASQFLQLFLFPPEVQHNFVAKLSGGERRRLYLCTVLMRNPNFLVLDEPTNDLDIATLNVLEEYLIGFKGCVIVVSHDRFFMDKVVDHILAFEGDGRIKDYPGNYTDYREWKALQEEDDRRGGISSTQKSATANKGEKYFAPTTTPAEKPRKLSYKEKQEFEALEHDIAALEIEKANIEAQLSGNETDNDKIISLSTRMGEIVNLIDEKMMRWMELSER